MEEKKTKKAQAEKVSEKESALIEENENLIPFSSHFNTKSI